MSVQAGNYVYNQDFNSSVINSAVTLDSGHHFRDRFFMCDGAEASRRSVCQMPEPLPASS